MNGKSEPRVFNDGLFGASSTFTKFHSLPLPLERIFLVDDTQSFRECTRALCVVSYVLCCFLRTSLGLYILERKTYSSSNVLQISATKATLQQNNCIIV